ncbi:hypothetical protein XHV734_3233 [Xanthomonas hortorum pv. vitians]|nr:hypothetical protein XHV734_3233 [Xanthomonas hortorum pv. vitians]
MFLHIDIVLNSDNKRDFAPENFAFDSRSDMTDIKCAIGHARCIVRSPCARGFTHF